MPVDLPECPVEITLQLIGNRWKMIIIKNLLDGPMRFTKLQKSLNGITQKVLTTNLRSMEKSDLLFRTVYAEVPPRVEYELTETGYSLKPVLDAMMVWGKSYNVKLDESENEGIELL